MDETRLTRPWLESLSTDELVKLADSFGVDIPAGLERIFIIEELLELGLAEDFVSESGPLGRPDFLEAAALPKQYNISYIEVMIRDPLWAFVFWEIKEAEREAFEKPPDFGGYFLRVIPLCDNHAVLEDSFTITVGVDDTAWYLGFPPEGGRYRVELCVRRGESETAITVSRSFKLPRLIELPNRKTEGVDEPQEASREAYRNPLVCFSGAREFSVTRSADRLSRAKR